MFICNYCTRIEFSQVMIQIHCKIEKLCHHSTINSSFHEKNAYIVQYRNPLSEYLQ
jgi:hypothetical protein